MSTPSVHRSIEVDATPDEVWELLIDDDERAAWFGGETTLSPEAGGDATFTEPDGTRRRAVIEDVDPRRRLSWAWWSEGDDDNGSHVRVDLEPIPGGTRISVVERPLTPTASTSALASATGPLLDLEVILLVRHACVG